VEAVVSFSGDGTIKSSDPVFDHEINSVLNLNLQFLKNNRKAVLDAFQMAVTKREMGAWTAATLGRELRRWNGESTGGLLEPYCQVIVDWIRRRLRRTGR
jgi:hypothetical protein